MPSSDLYLSRALAACFDGDGVGINAGDGGVGGSATDGLSAGEGTGGATGTVAGKTFTQDDLNRILADDRRKHQTQLAKVETTYKELLANNKSLSEKERSTLEENLATIQGQLRTKEQQANFEKKQLEEEFVVKLQGAEQQRQEWESRYRQETVERAIFDAAVGGDAYRPQQIINELRAYAKLVEVIDQKTSKATGKFKTVIEFPDVDRTTGEPTILTLSPEDAVKRMKELPELFGNMFRSNVVSGIGSNSATGGFAPGSGGKIDLRKLTPQQYREIRAKNPELLGLRPVGRR